MAQLEEVHLITMPLEDGAYERLLEFVQTNGYMPGLTRAVQDAEHAERDMFVRGRAGAGWWTSNLTDLHTELSITTLEEGIELRYRIDVRGQRLGPGERQFWRREAQRAEAVARGQAPVEDFRPAEEKRAAEAVRRMRRTGIIGAVVTFVVVCVAFALIVLR